MQLITGTHEIKTFNRCPNLRKIHCTEPTEETHHLTLVGIIFIWSVCKARIWIHDIFHFWKMPNLCQWISNIEEKQLFMHFFIFFILYICHKTGNYWCHNIPYEEIAIRRVVSTGSPLKTRAHSSNRSDLFYGTGYSGYSQKDFTRQLTNVIPINTTSKM